MRRLSAHMGFDVPVADVQSADEALEKFGGALPVWPLGLTVSARPGDPTTDTAEAVKRSIVIAVELAGAGAAGAVVTNPIQKKTRNVVGHRCCQFFLMSM